MEALKHELATRCYEFGPFLVDPVRCVLLRDGEIVPLGLKAFELLLMMIRHQGEVLRKDELLKQIWPDTIVEENNLARTISALRKALDEHPTEPQHILTIPGRGYRFVAQVREVGVSGEGSGAPALDQLESHTAPWERGARPSGRSCGHASEG